MPDEIAAARNALEPGRGRTIWHWDLASGRLEWDERLRSLFGYAETLTDAAWRENRIHPQERDRVAVSLQRATIVNHGAVWSERYRFRRADGSYATVTERAYVVQDDAGPRAVVGAITPASGPAARARPRG
jgi:PAS domain S-box-containing protein